MISGGNLIHTPNNIINLFERGLTRVARRRKKKEMDFIDFILVFPAFLAFYIVFNMTKSVKPAMITGAIVFGLCVGFLTARKMAWLEKLKKSGISDIDKMNGREFEHYLGVLFKSQGYSVNVTKASGDYGADLVITKEGKKIVIQAKRYSKNVSLKAVQEAVSSIAYYGASEAWVITNSKFTDSAIKLAKSNNVKLFDRHELVEMISKMNPSTIPDPKRAISEVAATAEVSCGRCGKPMILKHGSRGKFYGCSAYPNCKNTKSL
jgi:restriction system protein